MDSLPPVPPRPQSGAYALPVAPPLPPLPLNFYRDQSSAVSPPHLEEALVAPRPQKHDPTAVSNMARNLDNQLYQNNFDDRGTSPAPPPPPPGAGSFQGGFAMPGPQFGGGYSSPPPGNPQFPSYQMPQHAPYGGPSPPQSSYGPPPFAPTPYGASPYPGSPIPYPSAHTPQPDALSSSMAALAFNSHGPGDQRHPERTASYNAYAPPPQIAETTAPRAGSTLTAPIPAIPTLQGAIPTVQNPSHDPALRVAWARDVLFLVERSQQLGASEAVVGPVRIADSNLAMLANIAVPLILQIAGQAQGAMAPHQAEAVYWRATFAASGAYPDLVPHNPRGAFRDFEAAARQGYGRAWFRLGRDYENFGDSAHARECFERGVKGNVEACVYRMGMAHLMGQLGLAASSIDAVPLLHRAATLASIDVPQPAYVYGLLLLNEFTHVSIPANLFMPYLPASASMAVPSSHNSSLEARLQSEARKHLERAAFLSFAPAQYKLGHAYEFAQPPFPFDALLSVQYYSMASEGGEVEADMALSKWFLCGAEGGFEKDESLAYTFAEKAARKGLPSAEFAMGYYAEVGVGGPRNVDGARKWYQRASDHGNTDATERLSALSQPTPQALSRQEHDAITEVKLVRKRTQAKQRSDAVLPDFSAGSRPLVAPSGRQGVMEVVRQNSLAYEEQHGGRPSAGAMPSPGYNSPAPYNSSAPQSQMYPPSPVQQQHQTSPGQMNSVLPPNSSPRMRPQQPGRQQFPNQNRFTLSDPGGGSATGTPPPRQSVASPSMSAKPSPAPSSASKPSKGPATFAEMGISTGKAEDKDCVIM